MSETVVETINAINMLYVKYVGRLPEPSAVSFFLESTASLQQAEDIIASSDECLAVNEAVERVAEKLRPFKGKRKILLFGAYGNGNLGDREMAQTIAQRLEQHSEIVCFAYSELESTHYPFQPDRILLRADMPLNMRVMALFDVFLVGGGGLLSYPHDPLWNPVWARTVPIPVAILGCGVSSPIDPRLINLVARSSIASSRGELGLEELRRHNSASFLCHDPILSFHPQRQPTARWDGTNKPRRLYVLRAPLHPWHFQVKDSLADGDAVAVFEVHMDFPIVYNFDNVMCVSTAVEYDALVQQYDLIITERYHGAILSILGGKPTIGVKRGSHSQKFSELFSSLGAEDCLFDIESAPANPEYYNPAPAICALNSIRDEAESQYNAFAEQLLDLAVMASGVDASGSATERNSDHYGEALPENSIADACQTEEDTGSAPMPHTRALQKALEEAQNFATSRDLILNEVRAENEMLKLERDQILAAATEREDQLNAILLDERARVVFLHDEVSRLARK